jgi:uncharacterized protein YabE (DUF348 family)
VLLIFMNSLYHKSSVRYGMLAAASCAVLILGVVIANSSKADAASLVRPDGQRLVTIHDGTHERSVLTHETTLRQTLKKANIPFDSNDRIEPGLDEKLVANNYEVNIYRARPVTIVDGMSQTKVMTAYRTPKQIAKQAGVTLQNEDIATMTAPEDMVSDGMGLQLKITRATAFSLVLYGKKEQAYTQAKTVGEAIDQKGIKLAADDTLSLSRSTKITSNLTIELWRNGKQTVTEEQPIVFDTEQVKDADHEVGYKLVKTPGVNGTRTITYEIDMKNGVEVARKEIQNVVIKPAEKQVEVIGTKVNLPPGSHQDWMAAAGIAPSDFGYVEYIVGREGGWCPVRWQGDSGCVNHGSAPSGLGYGLVQATPGSKMVSAGPDWLTNPITQLRWASGYAVGRYGSWSGAYNHWLNSHNW